MQKQSLNWKELLIITTLLALIIIATSCTTKRVRIIDNRIMAHWMVEGEKAPYDGVLLNSYTYQNLIYKVKKCKKGK